MTLKVTIAPASGFHNAGSLDGFLAVCDMLPAMWGQGNTPEEAKQNFLDKNVAFPFEYEWRVNA